MTLDECLAHTPRRTLIALIYTHGGTPPDPPYKADLITWLSRRLSNPHLLQRAIAALPDPARQALAALVHAGGQIPARTFTARFGPLRPYRPWRDEEPRHPWRSPISVTEQLFYLGLIFQVRLPTDLSADEPVFLLPTDLLPHYPLSPGPGRAASCKQQAARARQYAIPDTRYPIPDTRYPIPDTPYLVPDLRRDLAHLLGYLAAHPIHPLHHRWLPPTVCRQINDRFSRPQPLADQRSELAAVRLLFLHYLAESAGFLELAAPGPSLKPTLLFPPPPSPRRCAPPPLLPASSCPSTTVQVAPCPSSLVPCYFQEPDRGDPAAQKDPGPRMRRRSGCRCLPQARPPSPAAG